MLQSICAVRLCLSPWGPVAVADRLCVVSEPEAHVAGVLPAHPHVSPGGSFSPLPHPALDPLGGHRHQVHMVLSAVLHRLYPGLILTNQNQFVWREKIKEKDTDPHVQFWSPPKILILSAVA